MTVIRHHTTTARRAFPGLAALVLATSLALAGCGGSSQTPDGEDTETSAAPSATATTEPAPTQTALPSPLPEPTATPGQDDTAADGDSDAPPFYANTEPDTGEASGGSVGTLTDIRVGGHEGFDRVVFEFNGPGVPSWNVRYVAEAVGDASGLPVDVDGDAILEVTLFPVAYPMDGTDPYTGPSVIAVAGTEQVTEVVNNSLFEGYLQAFIGIDDGEQPFRAYSMTDPARIVVEVQHAG